MKKEEGKNYDNSFGVASVIMGILSLAFFWTVVLGVVFAILGFIFGIIQLKRNKNSWTIVGIILSVAGLLFSVLVLIGYAAVLSQFENTMNTCIANPSQPGCEEITQLLGQQGALG